MLSVLIGILIIYFVQNSLYNKFWNLNLNVKAEFKKTKITEGKSVIIEECIENKKWLPMPMITIKYTLDGCFREKGVNKKKVSDHYNRNEIFSILMFQRIKRKINFTCSRRGIYKINRLVILAGNLFLNETYLCELESDSKLTVYPKYVDKKRFAYIFKNVYGDIATNNFMNEDPFIYRGLREYQTYDTIKMINWSATAKAGELKVNVLENTSQREAVILLNIQKDNIITNSEVIEEAIRLTKSFSLDLYKQGIRCLIYTNGIDIETKDIIKIESFKSTESYIDTVNDALAHIEVKENKNVYSEKEENCFVEMYNKKIEKFSQSKYLIFISNYQREDFQNMLKNLKKSGRNFSWIVPVSNRNDFHVDHNLSRETEIWRLNWEGAKSD